MHSHLSIAAAVLLDLGLIIVATRVVGAVFRRVGQPAVVGEILAGIALGPSLLGNVMVGGAPLSAHLFPTGVVHQLTGIANLGLALFMMMVGLELNVGPARSIGRRAATISVSSVALPMALGALLGVWLYRSMGITGSRTAFVLFIGVSMSVTAFPVLARILVERQLHKASLGGLVLACAGVDDVLAWSLLALATAIADGGGVGELARVLGLLSVYCVVLFRFVRPALRKLAAWHRREGRLTPTMLALILLGLSLSAAATEVIGVHFVFGAFLFGAALPRDEGSELVHDLLARLEQVTVLLLLPVFFVVTGLAVDLRSFGLGDLAVLCAVLVVACTGKFVGAAGAARLEGVSTRHSLAVGVLMNTRGLTELVVVTVGYQVGLLTKDLLTIFVIMAVVTTVLTKPLLRLVYPDALIARDARDAEHRIAASAGPYRCLVLVDGLSGAEDRAVLARDLCPQQTDVELVICWFTPLPSTPESVGLRLDRIGADLDQANTLADRLSDATLSCSVVHHASDDVRGDVLREVESWRPDCVVADAGLSFADDLVPHLSGDAELLLVGGTAASARAHPEVPGPVTVRVSGGPDTVGALALGVRMAQSRRVPLQLETISGGPRWSRRSSLATRLSRAGVRIQSADPAHLSGLVVTEGGHDRLVGSLTHVTVRAGRAGTSDDLTRRLSGPASPSTPTPSRSNA